MKSSEVKNLLANRYSAPEYAFFTEVPPSTGFAGSYCDAVAFHLWPSSGHPVYGFEVKVSRSDWLRELKQPAKPLVMQYCDKWWLVAPQGVAKVEEVPKAWGFLEIVEQKNGLRMITRKQAPDLTPVELPTSFYAALLRRATEHTIPHDTFHAKVAEEKAILEEHFKNTITRATEDLAGYRKDVAEWEEASGLKVLGHYRHSSKQLGRIVRWVLEGGLHRTIEYETSGAIKDLREVLGRLEEFKKMYGDFPEIDPEKL